MLSRHLWLLRQALRKVWVRVVSFAVLALASIALAKVLSPWIPASLGRILSLWRDHRGSVAPTKSSVGSRQADAGYVPCSGRGFVRLRFGARQVIPDGR